MRVLVVAAHPDDEVLGCGGTMARLVAEGAEVHVHVLGEGVTSRFDRRGDADRAALHELHAHSRAACARLGVERVRVHDLPDNRFDSLPLLEVVKRVEGLIGEVAPEVVYTHHGGDLNVDHGVVHRAVLTATRPVPGQVVQRVYAFEIPSSTEWALQRIDPVFRPNVFVDIAATLERKVEAMKAYPGEIRDFPHPRSPEGIEALARRWGTVAGFAAAEAFELVRSLSPTRGTP